MDDDIMTNDYKVEKLKALSSYIKKRFKDVYSS